MLISICYLRSIIISLMFLLSSLKSLVVYFINNLFYSINVYISLIVLEYYASDYAINCSSYVLTF